MARLAGADCGANLMERSYVLNDAGFALVAMSNAIGRPRPNICVTRGHFAVHRRLSCIISFAQVGFWIWRSRARARSRDLASDDQSEKNVTSDGPSSNDLHPNLHPQTVPAAETFGAHRHPCLPALHRVPGNRARSNPPRLRTYRWRRQSWRRWLANLGSSAAVATRTGPSPCAARPSP